MSGHSHSNSCWNWNNLCGAVGGLYAMTHTGVSKSHSIANTLDQQCFTAELTRVIYLHSNFTACSLVWLPLCLHHMRYLWLVDCWYPEAVSSDGAACWKPNPNSEQPLYYSGKGLGWLAGNMTKMMGHYKHVLKSSCKSSWLTWLIVQDDTFFYLKKDENRVSSHWKLIFQT